MILCPILTGTKFAKPYPYSSYWHKNPTLCFGFVALKLANGSALPGGEYPLIDGIMIKGGSHNLSESCILRVYQTQRHSVPVSNKLAKLGSPPKKSGGYIDLSVWVTRL